MHLTMWDYLTFVVFFIVGAGCLGTVVFILGLPGRIAIARNHPDAEAVKLMGYLGFLAVVPWIQAFLWAFKPVDTIDIRRYPKEEQQAIKDEIARLRGQGVAEPKVVPPAASSEGR